MSEDPEWFYPALNDTPCDNRAVVVLVAHKDGTFSADIGRYYREGWRKQTFETSPVIAWSNIPSFKDDTEIVEVDQT